jgi:hypothetical protein
MKSYHFNLGDSDDGPIGLCVRVTAASKKKALEALRRVLWENFPDQEVHVDVRDSSGGIPDNIEYVNVYLNPDKITERDIDEWEEV